MCMQGTPSTASKTRATTEALARLLAALQNRQAQYVQSTPAPGPCLNLGLHFPPFSSCQSVSPLIIPKGVQATLLLWVGFMLGRFLPCHGTLLQYIYASDLLTQVGCELHP